MRFLKYICVLLVLVIAIAAAVFLDNHDLFRPAPVPSEVRVTRPSLTEPEETAAPTESTVPAAETQPEETLPETKEYTLTLAGNCTLGCTNAVSYRGNGIIKTIGQDYAYPFRNVADYFAQDDFTFLNLEGPLTDTTAYSTRVQLFNGPTQYIEILSGASVEAVSLVNDHILDHGSEGYASTTALLEGAGIGYVEKDTSALFTLEDGFVIGVYGILHNAQDVTDEEVTAAIADLRKQADLVIFAPHWGTIGGYVATDAQIALAHAAIDAGADIVCGTHPYVLQPMEEYNGGVIFYSLGNFCVGSQTYLTDYDTALVRLQVLRQGETVRLGEVTVIPASISSSASLNNYQPTPYAPEDAAYATVLSKLEGTYPLRSIPIG